MDSLKKFNNFDLHFRFEVKDNINFVNAQYIHPLKQTLVQSYVECFQQDSNIKTAIIFGSSVEFRCNSFSDLDICLERYDREKAFRNYPEEYLEDTDIIYWDCAGDRLRKEISQKGIVVWDKEGLY